MTGRIAGLTAMIAATFVSSGALAVTEQDWQACVNDSGPAAIEGCTRVIDAKGAVKDEIRAMAYNNRALEFENTGDLDRALSDHTTAVQIQPKFALALAAAADLFA